MNDKIFMLVFLAILIVNVMTYFKKDNLIIDKEVFRNVCLAFEYGE